jgi:CRP-like cAMP-binding protein
MSSYEYRPGETIMLFDEPSVDLVVVQKGTVFVYNNIGAKLNTLHAPKTIGEMGFISGKPRSATIKAHGPCIVHRISYDDYCQRVQRSCLKKAPILSNLTVAELGSLLPFVKMTSYEDGKSVCIYVRVKSR